MTNYIILSRLNVVKMTGESITTIMALEELVPFQVALDALKYHRVQYATIPVSWCINLLTYWLRECNKQGLISISEYIGLSDQMMIGLGL